MLFQLQTASGNCINVFMVSQKGNFRILSPMSASLTERFHFYTLGFPHSEQNFPVFTAPQEQVHSAEGLGVPHS